MFTARTRVRQALPSLPWLLPEDPRQVPLDVGLPEGAAADPAMEQGHRGLWAGFPGPWHTVGAHGTILDQITGAAQGLPGRILAGAGPAQCLLAAVQGEGWPGEWTWGQYSLLYTL